MVLSLYCSCRDRPLRKGNFLHSLKQVPFNSDHVTFLPTRTSLMKTLIYFSIGTQILHKNYMYINKHTCIHTYLAEIVCRQFIHLQNEWRIQACPVIQKIRNTFVNHVRWKRETCILPEPFNSSICMKTAKIFENKRVVCITFL